MSSVSTTTLQRLRCEYQQNPLGIDVRQPRLSWQLVSDQRGAVQSAYQVQAAESAEALAVGGDLLWDSGKVASDQSLHVAYAGPALHSTQRCCWRVRAWDGAGLPTAWSADAAAWEMGLLGASDWSAGWITPDWEEDVTQSQPAPLLRRSFTLDGAVKSARVYVTALGLYELHLNGQRVGDGQLTPGWTSYDDRLQVQTYNVTGLLKTGDNALGAMLADGWYRGWLGFENNRNTFGKQLALLLELRVTYADGRTTVITSDDHWHAALGPIRMADIYNGETYDARLEQAGWDAAGFDERAWRGVRQLEYSKEILVAQFGPFVRRQEELKPRAILLSPAGETIYDFGQNMVGWVRLQVQGPAGATVTLQHAEVLDQQGNFYTANLRQAKQTVQYTLKGQGVEVFEPRFTFMGFQFVKVEGFPGEPTLDSLTGVVVHSDMPSSGSFECSNPLINQLQHNIVWGQKGNFVDVPTDCPQRDERLGWTGDAQVFVRTATFNRDVAGFFTKWLRDLAADQLPNGIVPNVVPNVMGRAAPSPFEVGGSSAWGDAGVIVPWTIYLAYGDRRILEEQYVSMSAWVNFIREQAGEKYLWDSGFHFGDWLDYRGLGGMEAVPATDRELVATAFYAYSTHLLMNTAQVLGKTDDAARLADQLAKVKAAFLKEFVAPGGRVASGSQTSYVLALHYDLLPEELRPSAAARLAQKVREFGYHLTTGFVGTPYLCHVLSRFGYTDLAYELLNQETYPSWLYPVKMGATTIWERWDGIKPDGSFQDAGMNSYNHYAYGAIGEWLYRVAAGIEIDPQQAGYKHILIQPQPGGGLTQVRAAYQSPYGEIVSAWQLSAQDFRLQATIPANTSATVRIPATDLAQVTESGQAVAGAFLKDGAVEVQIGSGQYDFTSRGLNQAKAMANVRHVAGRLDVSCGLRSLVKDERARAILVHHLGEAALNAPMPPWMGDQSLESMARFAPHLLTPEKLAAIQQELISL